MSISQRTADICAEILQRKNLTDKQAKQLIHEDGLGSSKCEKAVKSAIEPNLPNPPKKEQTPEPRKEADSKMSTTPKKSFSVAKSSSFLLPEARAGNTLEPTSKRHSSESKYSRIEQQSSVEHIAQSAAPMSGGAFSGQEATTEVEEAEESPPTSELFTYNPKEQLSDNPDSFEERPTEHESSSNIVLTALPMGLPEESTTESFGMIDEQPSAENNQFSQLDYRSERNSIVSTEGDFLGYVEVSKPQDNQEHHLVGSEVYFFGDEPKPPVKQKAFAGFFSGDVEIQGRYSQGMTYIRKPLSVFDGQIPSNLPRRGFEEKLESVNKHE